MSVDLNKLKKNHKPKENDEQAVDLIAYPKDYVDLQALTKLGQIEKLQKFDHIARTNPIVKRAIRMVHNATFWVKGVVKASPDNDYREYPEHAKIDKGLVSLIKKILKSFNHAYIGFDDCLKDMFYFGFVCGYAIAEKIWTQKDMWVTINGKSELMPIWVLSAIKPKNSWDFHPWVDDKGDLVAVFHRPSGQFLHPRRFIYGVWPFVHGGNYLGISEIEGIYEEVFLNQIHKKALTTITHKSSILPLTLEYNRNGNKKEREKVIHAVKNIENNTAIAFPATKSQDGELQSDYKLGVTKDLASANLINQMKLLEEQSAKDITRTLGPTDQLGMTNVSSGSYAKAKTEFNSFMARPESAQNWCENLVNDQLIRDIIEFNFPELLELENYNTPVYAFDILDEEVGKLVSDRVIAEKRAGIISRERSQEVLEHPPEVIEIEPENDDIDDTE